MAGGFFARSMQTAGPMPGWSGIWQLAMLTVIVVAVSQLAVACGNPTLPGGLRAVLARDASARAASARDAIPRQAIPQAASPGEAAPGEAAPPEAAPGEAGPREAVPRRAVSRDGSPRDGSPREAVPRDGSPRDTAPDAPRGGAQRDPVLRDGSAGGWPWRALAMPYGGRILLIVVLAPLLGARGVFLGLLGWAVVAFCYTIVSSRPRRAGAWAARVIAAYREDGLIATEIGIPVRGQLVPLPPALTGVAAVAVLAVLGLRNLPGLVLLAPVVAMLLASVGSSHPHDGPLDWLVPVMLQAGQFAYIAAIGVATGVPAPLIFAVGALIALHYADLAGYPRRGAIVGWEGRMITAGLGAALGIATFAYLLLAAYLGVLVCRESMTSWLPATEGDRR